MNFFNLIFQLQETLKAAEIDKTYWQKYFHDLNSSDYQSEVIRRQVDKLKILGNSALSPEKLQEVN